MASVAAASRLVVVPDSKYMDAARKRNSTLQQLLHGRLDRLQLDGTAAQDRIERDRKHVERYMYELKLETEAVESNAAVRGVIKRKIRRLRHDEDFQIVWTGSRSQQQLWQQIRRDAPTSTAGGGRARSAAQAAAGLQRGRASSAPLIRSVGLPEFDRRLGMWRHERTFLDRQTCCVHVDPRHGTSCFVPNVETRHLSGGYHLCLYRNIRV